MKKIVLALLLCFGLSLHGQNTQLTGTLSPPGSTQAAFTGYLYLNLSQSASVLLTCQSGSTLALPNTQVVVPIINGVMQNPPAVWGADCLNPRVPYNVVIRDGIGNTLVSTQWYIQGNTFNIGTAPQVNASIPKFCGGLFVCNNISNTLFGQQTIQGLNTTAPLLAFNNQAGTLESDVNAYGQYEPPSGLGCPTNVPNPGALAWDNSLQEYCNYTTGGWTHITGGGGSGIPYPSGTGIVTVVGSAAWGTTLNTIGTGSVVLANGTPAGNKYIDGASQAWTALPYQTLATSGSNCALATLVNGVLTIPPCTPSGGGGLDSFTVGNLSPLFTAALGANPTTAPALAFTASTAAQNSVLAGPATGGAGAYSFQTAPTISAANMTNFPTLNQNTNGLASNITATSNSTLVTLSALQLNYSQLIGSVTIWNQNTTGNANTATALAALPSQCTSGEFATGIAANGNANCDTPATSSSPSTTGLAFWDNTIPGWGTSYGTSGTGLTVVLNNSPTITTPTITGGATFTGTTNGNIALASVGVLPSAPGTSTILLTVPNSITAYTIILPGAVAGTAGSTFSSDTSGNLNWALLPITQAVSGSLFLTGYNATTGAFSTGTPATGFPITIGSTSIATGSTTTAITGLTIDGVSPTTMGFVDPTSSIQTQLNGKQSSGTYVTAITIASANGISGSSAGGATPALTLALGAITPTSTNGVLAATMAFMDATSSIQTQLNAKAPLASPALTGTPTAPTQSCGSNTDIATGAYVATCASGLPSSSSGQIYANIAGTPGASSAITVTSAGATGSVGFDNTAPVATLDHIGAESHLGIANVNTTLNGSITATSASLTLTSGTGWPAAGGYAVIMAASGGGTPEWICFSAVSSTTMTIGGGHCLTPVTTSGRSYFSSVAATHASGSAIYLVESLNQVSATTPPTFWIMNGTYFFNDSATDVHMNQYGANVVVVGSGAGFGPSLTALDGLVPGGFGAAQITANTLGISLLNGNSNSMWVSAPTVLASNTTITSTSFVTTGVSIAVQGAASAHGRCVIGYSTASAGTIKFGLVTTSAPTRLDVFAIDSTGTATIPFNALGITTATTTTISGLDTAATVTSGNFSFDFIVNANNTNNTLTVDALTTNGAGNTLTIDTSSYCTFN